MKAEELKELSYEDAVGRLEIIVENLEKGEISLEESLKVFQEGIELARLCRGKLDALEERVETLLREERKQGAGQGGEGEEAPDGKG